MIKQRELLNEFFRLDNPGIEAFFESLLKLQQISFDHQPFEDAQVLPFLELFSGYFKICRLSFWHLKSDTRGRYLECAAVFGKQSKFVPTGVKMYETDYVVYFNFMDRKVAFAADDLFVHPYSKEFAESYFKPLDIRSGMDAPLHVLGEVVGIICAEQTGENRHWTEKEEGSLIHLACQVSALLVTRELESRVAQRTEDLKASEERVRSLAAKLVNEAKLAALGEMAGSIAHEIKNPMTVILGRAIHLADRIRKGLVLTGEVEKTLGLIEATSDRVLQIVQSMKTYTRDASYDLLVEFSVKDSVRESLQMMATRLESNAFEIRQEIPEELIFKARPGPVMQILINLISNAIDANEESELRWVHIRAKRVASTIEVLFSDSGSGIPLKIVERMFLPLYTTKESAQATGLGLSIAKGIAQGMGGDLTYVPAALNTTFVLKLPSATF